MNTAFGRGVLRRIMCSIGWHRPTIKVDEGRAWRCVCGEERCLEAWVW